MNRLKKILCVSSIAILAASAAWGAALRPPRPTPSSPGQAASVPVEIPAAPKAPMAVLWDQPLSSVNQGAYVNQSFPDLAAYSSYLADDFTNAAPWTITKIVIPGDGWNGFTGLGSASSLVFSIYADAAGLPAGYPGGGAAPTWTLSVPPGDAQVALSPGTPSGYPATVTLTLTTPISLPAGTWWLVYYPDLAFSPYGQFGRQASDTTNGAVAQFINPGGGFGYGTTYQNWTVLGMAQQDCAFRLEGEACSPSVSVTMSALGGTTADWPVTHGSQSGRLTRDGVASTCDTPKAACPGVYDASGRLYDAFSFSNTSGSATCLTATLATECSGTNYLFAVAYLGSFDPANLCTNYLADLGSSPTGSGAMSFTLPAGDDVVIVVHEVTSEAGCPSGYNLTVSGFACGGVTCPTITLSPTTLPAGTQGGAYSTTLSATGGTAPYTFAVTSGSLPGGLALATDGTLSGTFSGSGDYTFTVTATDADECTGTATYTISVSAFDLSFMDDGGATQLCLNTGAGTYSFTIFSGPAAGTFSGTCTLSDMRLGMLTITSRGGGGSLFAVYSSLRHVAQATFTRASKGGSGMREAGLAPLTLKATLKDSDTLDDPPCGGVPDRVVDPR